MNDNYDILVNCFPIAALRSYLVRGLSSSYQAAGYTRTTRSANVYGSAQVIKMQPFLTYRLLNALMQTLRHVSRAFRCAVCALLHVSSQCGLRPCWYCYRCFFLSFVVQELAVSLEWVLHPPPTFDFKILAVMEKYF